MIPILLPLIIASLVPHSSLVYSVQVNVNNTIYSYTYNFTIICIKNDMIEFNLTISGNNYYSIMTYNVSENNPYPLPINYVAFNTTNLAFVRNITLNGNLTEEFSGVFHALDKYEIPITAYFYDGILQQMNGTYNGISVYVNREYVAPPTSVTPSNNSLGNYLTLIIFIIVLIIAIVVLIKIGKI